MRRALHATLGGPGAQGRCPPRLRRALHWGTGLAERLVHGVIALRPAHVRFLRSSTLTSNMAAQRLARRIGFAPYSVEPVSLMVDGVLVDEVWMQLDVSQYVRPASP